MFRTLFALAVAAALTALPDAVPAQDAAAPPAATISTADSRQADADIAVRMCDILAELGGYEDVTVQVNQGVVTLRGTTASAADATALTDLSGRIEGVVSVRNRVTETTDIVRRLNPAVERFRARVDQVLIFLPLAAIAAAVFAAVLLVGLRIARARNPWDRIAPNAFIADLYRQVVRLAFGVLGLVVALDIMNATALLSTILGAAGLIGLAIGFAVRDTVENFIASVLLSVRQPFRPNDVVEINGDQGKVIRLTSRATILLSFDGNHIRIPNATVFKSRIINFSENAERRFQFTLTVEAGSDLARARAIAAETVQALPFVLAEPAAAVWLGEMTHSGVEVVVTGWIDQHATSIVQARGEALRLVKAALEAAGYGFPDPTYRLRMEPPGGPAPVPSGEAADAPVPPLPRPAESLVAGDVGATPEQALDRLIDAERVADGKEDLLRDNALKE